jgi:hypothetical protein
MPFSLKNIRLDGCKLGAPSPKDYRTVFKDLRIPDRVDLRPFCTPVENQGQLGSCTANASVGALECLYKKRDGRADDLSRLFVYFNARRMTGRTAEDTGCFIREAMASILGFGVCRERTWPYEIDKFAVEPVSQAYSEAAQYGAIQYSLVAGSGGALSALAAGYPVVFGIALPSRCYEEAAGTGVVPQTTEEERRAPRESGHAMLIVGYDMGTQRFIVRNSWGEDWGDRGYCTMPFSLIDDFSSNNELWIVTQPEGQTNFSIIRPAASAAPVAARPPQAKLTVSQSASSLRDEIRASLTRDMEASSQKIDSILRGHMDAQGNALRAGPSVSRYPFPVSLGGGRSFVGGFGEEPNKAEADDKHFFVGIWRGRFEVMGMSCSIEMILQPGGEYSSLTRSDNGYYALRALGTWQLLGQGNLHIHYNDHDPKEWNHTKLIFPDDENIQFRVINRNQMQSNLCVWQRG